MGAQKQDGQQNLRQSVNILGYMGVTYAALSDPGKQRECLEKALELCDKAPSPSGSRSRLRGRVGSNEVLLDQRRRTMISLADAYDKLGEVEKRQRILSDVSERD